MVERELDREAKQVEAGRQATHRKRARDSEPNIPAPAPTPESTSLPHNPTGGEQRQILQQFTDCTSFALVRELVCAVCGEKHPAAVTDGGRGTEHKDRLRTRIQIHELDNELITTLVDTLMHPERKGGTYPCPKLDGLLLDVCGFCSTGGNDETHTSTKIQICTTCYSVSFCCFVVRRTWLCNS